MEYKLGLIGYPVGHSRSPFIHSKLAGIKGIDLSYELLLTPPQELAKRVKDLFDEGFTGFNVTVPHKINVIPLIGTISQDASSVNAVNTCLRTDNGFNGFNTDISGFKRSLTANDIEVTGKNCVVLGAGGAARSLVYSLITLGARNIYIINRSRDNALKLIDDLKKASDVSNVKAVSEEELLRNIRKNGALGIAGNGHGNTASEISGNGRFIGFQATSAELNSDESVVKDPALFDLFDVSYDIVAVKEPTPFIRQSRERGIRSVNGFDMLYYQAEAAFEIWTGLKVSKEEALIVREELKS
jgi:shikimate dehydrogenase